MKFFTDKTVKNDYLLIKITDYLKLRNKNINLSKWKEIFIDCCVYELKRANEYSWINQVNIKDFLDSLPNNHYFSFDYPSDMNLKNQNLFIKKSWINAIKYQNHSQYIVSVQYKLNDFWSFVEWFDKYNELSIKSDILGLGNMCRIKYFTEFLENSLDYAFSNCNHSRIHIYGLCLKAIPFSIKLSKRYNIQLSIDSTKWTKACTVYLKNKYKTISCNRDNRQEFFNAYLQLIKNKLKT